MKKVKTKKTQDLSTQTANVDVVITWYDYLKSYLSFILSIVLIGIALLFGFSLIIGNSHFIVEGWSAQPYISYGSLVVVQKTDTVEVGDFITRSTGSAYVTHRVVEVREDGTFITSQTGGGTYDGVVLSLDGDNIVGKVVLVVPNILNIINFIKNYYWAILPLLFALYGINVLLTNILRKNAEKEFLNANNSGI